MATSAQLSPLGEAALQYARDGLRVFPCMPLRKQPAVDAWPRRATTDAWQVRRWWRQRPDYNVAVLTGAPGPDVLDIDVRANGDGFGALEALRAAGRLAYVRRVVRTPSGGEHWWFDGTQRGKSKPHRHVDFQAHGGYVLAPPSVLEVDGERREYVEVARHPRGRSRWDPLQFEDVLADVPGARMALRSRVARNRVGIAGRHRSPQQYLARAQEGERNNALFRAACWSIGIGADPWSLVDTARGLGLGEQEIRDTITSALRTRQGGK